jgi:anti-sigma regulatory factor (Ser/Thr protein kinase)
MGDRSGAVAADRLLFQTTDPAREKERFFSELRAFADTAHWSAPIENEIELILEEWWANLVNYAFAETSKPRIHIEIDSSAQTANIIVRDNGIAFDPVARADPDFSIPVEQRPIGGLGIYMIKKLSTKISSTRQGAENCLRIEKDLTRPVLGGPKK